MSAIRILILDDEPLAVKLINEYARQIPEIEVVYAGTQAYQAIQLIQSQPIDLIFLDIQMPDLTGIELMQLFNQQHHFIITSAYQEYALDAFRFQVVDFLLKPIVFSRFRQSIDKFLQWQQNFTRTADNGYIFVKADRKHHQIAIDTIEHIEALKDYIRICTTVNTILVWENMKDILERLPQDQFLRIHRSHIVSVKQIKVVEGNRIQLQNANWLPIGETYRRTVTEWINKRPNP